MKKDSRCYLGNMRLYTIWQHMKTRCTNPKYKGYMLYGGRGISVCGEWKSNYTAFYEWAMANGYSAGLSLDRLDNDKGYSPDNCRWADMKTQQNNRRNNKLITYNGKTQTLTQWSEELGIAYKTLWQRIFNYKWDIKKAFNQR